MFAWLPKLVTLIPVLGPALLGLFGVGNDSARAAELRAEKELIEAKAFARGRWYSPKYLTRYVLVVVFLCFSTAIFLAVFFPSAMPDADLSRLRDLITTGENMAEKM